MGRLQYENAQLKAQIAQLTALGTLPMPEATPLEAPVPMPPPNKRKRAHQERVNG